MRKLLGRLLLVLIVAGFGLGTDLHFMKVQAQGSMPSSMETLEAEIAGQLLLQKTDMSLTYAGNKAELSAGIAEMMRRAIRRDDYIAYIVDSYFYSVRTWGSTASVRIKVRYRESAEETQQVDAAIRSVLPSIIHDGMSEEEKVRAIHDWAALHLSYDDTLQRYTAYEGLTQGKTVCQGYTLLVHRMLQAAGITSRIIEGQVNTGSHVWNLVRIGGNWHHVDVTWDDPLPDRPGHVRYTYFKRNDEQMREDHQWVNVYPAANRQS